MLLRRFATRAPLLALTVALLVAEAPPAAASPDAPTPDEVCALLTAADATALVGKTAEATPGSSSHGGAACTWSDGAKNGLQVLIQTDALHRAASSSKTPPTAARRFKEETNTLIAKGWARVVSGVGDKAVWSTAFHRLWVLKGKKVAVLTVIKERSPADDLAGAKALAAKVLAKL